MGDGFFQLPIPICCLFSPTAMIATHNPAVFVLVVEPDETLANQLAGDLQEAGYDAIVTHDAANGLKYCRGGSSNQTHRQPALIPHSAPQTVPEGNYGDKKSKLA